jgi:hypothetical protein
VDADVVRGPARAELLAASRELTDEVGKGAVVRVAAGLGTKDGDRVVGGALPVAVKVGRAWAEEDEAGMVHGPHRVEVQLRVEGPPERVGREDV